MNCRQRILSAVLMLLVFAALCTPIADGAATDPPRRYREISEEFMRTGDAQSAVDAFKALVDKEPDHAPAWFSLGQLAMQVGEWDLAELALQTFKELGPSEPYASAADTALRSVKAKRNVGYDDDRYGTLLAEAVAADRAGRPAQAVELAGRAAAAEPTRADAYVLAASILVGAEAFDDSLRLLHEAKLAVDSSSRPLLESIESRVSELANESARLETAVDKLRSGDARGALGLVLPLADREDAPEATVFLAASAASLSGNPVKARQLLARLSGHHDPQVVELARRRIDEVGGESFSRREQMKAVAKSIRDRLASGHVAEAIDEGEQFIESLGLGPEVGDLFEASGDALSAAGRNQEAIRRYSAAIAMRPADGLLHLKRARSRSAVDASRELVLMDYLEADANATDADVRRIALQSAYEVAHRRDTDEARRIAERMRASFPEHGYGDCLLGILLAEEFAGGGDLATAESAVAAFDRAAQLGMPQPSGLRLLGGADELRWDDYAETADLIRMRLNIALGRHSAAIEIASARVGSGTSASEFQEFLDNHTWQFVVVMTDSDLGAERYWVSDEWKERIAKGWEDDLDLVGTAYAGGPWVVAMADRPGVARTSWITNSKFPAATIGEYWDDDYHVTDIAYGGGSWRVLLTQYEDESYSQTYSLTEDFPSDWIKENWGKGKDITDVDYADGKWVVVMTGGGLVENRGFRWADPDQLSDELNDLLRDGNVITDLALAPSGRVCVIYSDSGEGVGGEQIVVTGWGDMPRDSIRRIWEEYNYDITLVKVFRRVP